MSVSGLYQNLKKVTGSSTAKCPIFTIQVDLESNGFLKNAQREKQLVKVSCMSMCLLQLVTKFQRRKTVQLIRCFRPWSVKKQNHLLPMIVVLVRTPLLESCYVSYSEEAAPGHLNWPSSRVCTHTEGKWDQTQNDKNIRGGCGGVSFERTEVDTCGRGSVRALARVSCCSCFALPVVQELIIITPHQLFQCHLVLLVSNISTQRFHQLPNGKLTDTCCFALQQRLTRISLENDSWRWGKRCNSTVFICSSEQ